jgi:hypothetical protein
VPPIRQDVLTVDCLGVPGGRQFAERQQGALRLIREGRALLRLTGRRRGSGRARRGGAARPQKIKGISIFVDCWYSG